MSWQPNVFDKYAEVRSALGGVTPQEVSFPVAASQNIKKGDILSLSSGAVQQAIALPGADNTATASGGNLPIVGIAGADITTDATGYETNAGVSRNTIPVIIFDNNTQLGLRVWNATATNAEYQDVAVGTAYQFARYRLNSTTSWYVLTTVTTNGELKVVSPLYAAGYAATDQYPVFYTRAIMSETVRQV